MLIRIHEAYSERPLHKESKRKLQLMSGIEPDPQRRESLNSLKAAALFVLSESHKSNQCSCRKVQASQKDFSHHVEISLKRIVKDVLFINTNAHVIFAYII